MYRCRIKEIWGRSRGTNDSKKKVDSNARPLGCVVSSIVVIVEYASASRILTAAAQTPT